jgi:hypothetical protein
MINIRFTGGEVKKASQCVAGDVVQGEMLDKYYLIVRRGDYVRLACAENSTPCLDLPSFRPNGLCRTARVTVLGRLEIDIEE